MNKLKIHHFMVFHLCLILIPVSFINASIYLAVENSNMSVPDLNPGTEHSFTYNKQDILYYIPNSIDPLTTKIFFVIHGASRTYDLYFERWMNTNVAEDENVVVIAPHFDIDLFSHYQLLNIWGLRADKRLIQIFNDFSDWLKLEADKFFIFGFSGGGQFVHRFSMLHPEYIDRAVAGAAGFYTFPDQTFYPYGIKTYFFHPLDLDFDLEKALSVNLGIIVGDEDIYRTDNLIQTIGADKQGLNRLERAVNWITAMNDTAIMNTWDFKYDFKIVPGIGHSSSGVIFDSKNYLFAGGF